MEYNAGDDALLSISGRTLVNTEQILFIQLDYLHVYESICINTVATFSPPPPDPTIILLKTILLTNTLRSRPVT